MTQLEGPRLYRLPPGSAAENDPAIPRRSPQQLLCFPHAGGSWTAYRDWPRHLPPEVEVIALQLPGRGSQLRATPYTQMGVLVRDLVDVLRPALRPPVSFFGHSMGALIAFETARELVRRGAPSLHRLFVSGSNAPPTVRSANPIHRLDDQAMKQELRGRYGGSLPDPELLDILLPAIRADFSIVETYQYRPGPPLACPIVAFGGTDDPAVTAAGLRAWSRRTASRSRGHWLPGQHFFLESCPELLLRLVVAELEDGREAARPIGSCPSASRRRPPPSPDAQPWCSRGDRSATGN